MLGRMCLLRDLHFTLRNVVVSQQFDKHLYLTSCLNARNRTARKMAFFISSQDRQTHVLAGDAMTTTIIID